MNQMLMKKTLIREYAEEIARLRLELDATRAKNGIYLPPELYDELNEARIANRDHVSVLERQLNDRSEEKEVLQRANSEARERLSQMEGQAAENRERLAASEAALLQAREQIRQLDQEISEMRYVLDHRKETEDKLSREAMVLMNNLTQSLGDLDAMHNKVQREEKRKLEWARHIHELEGMFQERSDNVRASCQAWQSSIEEQLNSMMSAIVSCSAQFSKKSMEEHAHEVYSGSGPKDLDHDRDPIMLQTPKRRTWSYPKKLSRTRDPETLLISYRNAQVAQQAEQQATGKPIDLTLSTILPTHEIQSRVDPLRDRNVAAQRAPAYPTQRHPKSASNATQKQDPSDASVDENAVVN